MITINVNSVELFTNYVTGALKCLFSSIPIARHYSSFISCKLFIKWLHGSVSMYYVCAVICLQVVRNDWFGLCTPPPPALPGGGGEKECLFLSPTPRAAPDREVAGVCCPLVSIDGSKEGQLLKGRVVEINDFLLLLRRLSGGYPLKLVGGEIMKRI